MDCSSPGSSVHRITQARILEGVAIFFSSKEYIHKLKKNKNVLWKSTATRIELAGNYLYLILLIYPQTITNILVGFPGNSIGKETSCSAGDLSSVPGSGRSPGEENGNPLQYPCLDNPMDSWLRSIGSQRAGHHWSDLAHEPLELLCSGIHELSDLQEFWVMRQWLLSFGI